jgi:hypothetical protein
MLDRRLLARFGRQPEAAEAALARELEAFRALPTRLAAVWTLPRVPGAWSPAEVSEHVLKVNVAMSKTLHLLRRDAPLPEGPRTAGVLKEGRAQAPAFSHPGPPQPWSALEPAWLEMERRLLAEVRATRDWHGRSWFHPYFGELDALGWVQAGALHMAHHRRQLEEREVQ